MSFTQPCFIRKNTPELCQRLKELGYYQNFLDDNSGEWLAVNHGMFISINEGFQNLPFDDIDCDNNEELFLALAALRDNSDKNQWFIYDEDTSFLQKGDWYMCSLNHHLSPSHKATVGEIIKHFKTK